MDKVEQVIERLTEAGVSINEIVEKLQIERGNFYSWRKSTKQERREEMAEKIIGLFPEMFPDGWENEGEPENDQSKYVRLLEETVQELRKDKETLNRMIEILAAQK